jgi:uncharacterized membrane protein YhdT
MSISEGGVGPHGEFGPRASTSFPFSFSFSCFLFYIFFSYFKYSLDTHLNAQSKKGSACNARLILLYIPIIYLVICFIYAALIKNSDFSNTVLV